MDRHAFAIAGSALLRQLHDNLSTAVQEHHDAQSRGVNEALLEALSDAHMQLAAAEQLRRQEVQLLVEREAHASIEREAARVGRSEWDTLFDAVKDRLHGIVGDAAVAHAAHAEGDADRVRVAVLECVQALAQLQAMLAREQAAHAPTV